MQNKKITYQCPTCGSDEITELADTTLAGTTRLRCRVCKQRFTKNTALKPGDKPELTIVYDADGLGVTLSTTSRTMSLDQLLDRFKIDRTMWIPEEPLINVWGVTSFGSKRGDNAEVIRVPYYAENFQMKVRLKKAVNIQEFGKFKRDFIQTVKKQSPKIPAITRPKQKSDYQRNLFEPNLYDLHLGKLGWDPETMDGNYDYKIAWDRGMACVDDLIMKATMFDIDRILLPWGHDFFNSDHENTGEATTNAGTPQQNEGRWQKMWKIGRELTIMTIEKLKLIAPVDVVIIPGNHDMQKMFYLGDLLEVKYENDKNVTIDNEPKMRKYYRYGNTLLGLTHQVGGRNVPNEQRLLQMMPAEQNSSLDFAQTEFHEWHVGHFHHSKRNTLPHYQDHQGISIRYMRSPSNADAWHANSGWVGAVKGAEGLIHNFKTGPVASFTHNIVMSEK